MYMMYVCCFTVLQNLNSLNSVDAFIELPPVTNWYHGSESEDTVRYGHVLLCVVPHVHIS